MDRFWLSAYPHGIPADIDPDRYVSLAALFDDVCQRFSDRPAFNGMGHAISFGELQRQAQDFAAWLAHVAGIRKGDRVALMMPNLVQYPVALFGVLLAGGVVVNTNPLYTARELRHQLEDSGAVAIVVLENFAHVLEEALPGSQVRTVVATTVGDELPFLKAQLANLVVRHVRHMVPAWHIDGAVRFRDALAAGRDLVLQRPPLDGGDLAFLQYTGGTTGVPKGAMLTHRNLVANTLQTQAWVCATLEEGREVAVIPLPLYHVFALTATLSFFLLGAECVLIANPRDLPAFVAELARRPFSAIIGVNTLFNALLDAPGIERVDTHALKIAVAGGMAVQSAVAQRWKARFGLPIIEGYGLTECAPIVCANPLTIDDYTGMIGLPVPSTEVTVRDEAGRALAPGETGEICVRGPQVMRGYWLRPEETARVFWPEGWLRTGDMGFFTPEGYVKLVDRKKDVIIVSGFKVFPNEIEEVVALHEDVREVAAIPVPDARSGEAVMIVVVRRSDSLTAEILLEHCRRNLTGYKQPRHVVFRDEPLPKSPIGKVLRRVVREQQQDASPASASAPPQAA